MSNLLQKLLSQLSAILFLAAILKMAEFQMARDQNLMCVRQITYGENFMLVSSTEVFAPCTGPLYDKLSKKN